MDVREMVGYLKTMLSSAFSRLLGWIVGYSVAATRSNNADLEFWTTEMLHYNIARP